MKLVADCGSTKIQWATVADSCTNDVFTARGFNPVILNEQEIASALISSVPQQIQSQPVDEVWFYGAGCRSDREYAIISKAIRHIWHDCTVHVGSDILGAAIALHGNAPGIACILGTGSAAALYDPKRGITRITPPLGYILGDEASGADIGKHIINAVEKALLPKALCDKFHHDTGTTTASIIECVYRAPEPNTFLASFAPWAADNMHHTEIREIIAARIATFIRHNITPLTPHSSIPVGFVGSIAIAFEHILREECNKADIKITNIIKSPITLLSNHHCHGNEQTTRF